MLEFLFNKVGGLKAFSSQKQRFLKNFAILTEKQLCWSLFFNNVAGLKAGNFIKEETPIQVFSCEYREIFQNSSFYRTSPVVASKPYYKERQVFSFEICKIFNNTIFLRSSSSQWPFLRFNSCFQRIPNKNRCNCHAITRHAPPSS